MRTVDQDEREAAEKGELSRFIYYRQAIGDDPGIQTRDYPAYTYIEQGPLYVKCLHTGEMVPFYPGRGRADR